MPNPDTKLQCPTCKKTVEWNDKFPHRPFCSKRCQLIDFGDWAEEKNRIPEKDGGQPLASENFDPNTGQRH